MDYDEFLATKAVSDPATGLASVPPLNPMLFDFQRDIVAWALCRGRAAIFAECGLGKGPMAMEWARCQPHECIIAAPLAVAQQFLREADKFGIELTYAKSHADIKTRLTVTNYERLDGFRLEQFGAVSLDESSILKSYMGKTKRHLVSAFSNTPFRLACTATPAPNDHMELGNHAEFLGAMDSTEMISRWFINDAMEAGNYRLKAHGSKDFWRWVSSWAVSAAKPSDIGPYSDDGFILPPLNIALKCIESPPPEGMLFHTGEVLSATQIHRTKRASAGERAAIAAQFANATDEQCLIWCDANYEADALAPLVRGGVEVRGSDAPERKEQALMDFADGKIRVLITKPSIAGFGMNFQGCHRVVFVGLSYSFESLYQALRRSWRFGQKSPVEVLIVESEAEMGIRANVERKMADHETMKAEMVDNMRDFQVAHGRTLAPLGDLDVKSDERYTLYCGDCVQAAKQIESGTIDYSIFSPPFANLYIYSDSIADMGNCANHAEFFAQMKFLIQQIYRVTVNGRLCSVHCKDLPAYKGRDGAAGLIDFPGACIRAFEADGWQYHSRVTIWKDPVIEMQRTKNHGLLHKQLCKDSAASRQGMADYLITFRKWDGEEFPRPVHGPSKDVRFNGEYIGTDGPKNASTERDYSIQVWQRYASPVWHDINQTDVLQGSRYATSEEDERHICPLQLGVIRRAIDLWTNPGDLVFSPFAGIGSEGYIALQMGRRFVGAELKASYWTQACKNLESARSEQAGLFAETA